MRTVKFKKWIHRIEKDVECEGNFFGKRTIVIDGTNCWEDDFTHVGMFHQWAYNYEEFTDGVGNYTVALVELPDGTIEEVLPKNIKFID